MEIAFYRDGSAGLAQGVQYKKKHGHQPKGSHATRQLEE
jgi:hypothetical protein